MVTIKYKKLSDKYAPEIRSIIKKFKNKNERQLAFKQIAHRLDREAFGIKYKEVKTTQRRLGKYKAREVQNL